MDAPASQGASRGGVLGSLEGMAYRERGSIDRHEPIQTLDLTSVAPRLGAVLCAVWFSSGIRSLRSSVRARDRASPAGIRNAERALLDWS